MGLMDLWGFEFIQSHILKIWRRTYPHEGNGKMIYGKHIGILLAKRRFADRICSSKQVAQSDRMNRQKVYLDTSVISHLQHEDVPEKMQDTLLFWQMLEAGGYEVVISDITLMELKQCFEPKRSELLGYLGTINYALLPQTDEVDALAEAYVENGVLSRKSMGDCQHIAFATISGCDVIVSWNFKHMVRMTTIQKVRTINAMKGYFKLLDIVSPTVMLGDDADE